MERSNQRPRRGSVQTDPVNVAGVAAPRVWFDDVWSEMRG